MAKKKYKKKKKKPSAAQRNAAVKKAPVKTARKSGKPVKKQTAKKNPLPKKQIAEKAAAIRKSIQDRCAAIKAPKPKKEKNVRPQKVRTDAVRKVKTEKSKGNNKLRFAAMIVLAVLLVCSVPLILVSRHNEKLYNSVEFTYAGMLHEEYLYSMDIDAAEQAERVEGMKRHGKKKAFDYFCNETLEFDSASSYGSVLFANVECNDCILVFTIKDEDGNMLFRSGGIEPGKYVSQLRLYNRLEVGTHPARLFVTGYDRETKACIGVQYTDVEIRIGDMYND